MTRLARHSAQPGVAPESVRVGIAADAEIVAAGLERYRTLYMRTLLEYLPVGEPRAYLYDMVADYPLRGGKGLRPSLCIASCGAFGGNPIDAVEPAVTFELLHNAFLIHDDIEDGSDLRRGQATLHVARGVPLALNAGDGLMMMSLNPILDMAERFSPGVAIMVLKEIQHLITETVEGQALELGWRADNSLGLTEVDYFRLIVKKTCWYTTIHPLRVGALMAGCDERQADELVDFAVSIGSLFQIKDDILNVIGDENKYGKEIGGDLYEGKRTLLLLHLLRNVDRAERRRLETFLGRARHDRHEDDVSWIRSLMIERGCVDEAWSWVDGLRNRAVDEAEAVLGCLPQTPHREFLMALPDYLRGSES